MEPEPAQQEHSKAKGRTGAAQGSVDKDASGLRRILAEVMPQDQASDITWAGGQGGQMSLYRVCMGC